MSSSTANQCPDTSDSEWNPLGKIVIGIAVVAILMLFGGTLLPLLLHLLLLPLEYAELLFEHFVEHSLHVDTRTAQVITAWTGLLLFVAIVTFVLRRCARTFRNWRARLAHETE